MRLNVYVIKEDSFRSFFVGDEGFAFSTRTARVDTVRSRTPPFSFFSLF